MSVELDQVSFAYGQRVIFEGASASFEAGALNVVMGPSGCGKSALFSLIDGSLTPTSGAIVRSSQARMSRVFQEYRLVPFLNALDNVALAQEFVEGDEPLPQAECLLEDLGLGDHVQERVSTLSGGEQQRVAIARALATAPSVILADEPTGALDENATHGIADLLANLAHSRGIVVIVATHDPAVAEVADIHYQIQHHQLWRR